LARQVKVSVRDQTTQDGLRFPVEQGAQVGMGAGAVGQQQQSPLALLQLTLTRLQLGAGLICLDEEHGRCGVVHRTACKEKLTNP